MHALLRIRGEVTDTGDMCCRGLSEPWLLMGRASRWSQRAQTGR